MSNDFNDLFALDIFSLNWRNEWSEGYTIHPLDDELYFKKTADVPVL
jgi:hypothetical protein